MEDLDRNAASRDTIIAIRTGRDHFAQVDTILGNSML